MQSEDESQESERLVDRGVQMNPARLAEVRAGGGYIRRCPPVGRSVGGRTVWVTSSYGEGRSRVLMLLSRLLTFDYTH